MSFLIPLSSTLFPSPYSLCPLSPTSYTPSHSSSLSPSRSSLLSPSPSSYPPPSPHLPPPLPFLPHLPHLLRPPKYSQQIPSCELSHVFLGPARVLEHLGEKERVLAHVLQAHGSPEGIRKRGFQRISIMLRGYVSNEGVRFIRKPIARAIEKLIWKSGN